MGSRGSKQSGIKQWATDDRPREKMAMKGAASLSNAELIAILLHSGTTERSAVDVAREILTLSGNDLNRLARLTVKDFQKIRGVGPARAITLMAALELGRRRQSNEVLDKSTITGSKDLAAVVVPLLQDLTHEVFYVFYLNKANKILHHEVVSTGGTDATVADVKIIMKNALNYLAASICVAHNHPSGNLRPSATDKTLTAKLKSAAAMLDIRLLDHIIVGGQQYFSFCDEGLL